MKFKKLALGALAAVIVIGTAAWFSLDKETRGLLATVSTNRDLLFWSQPQRKEISGCCIQAATRDLARFGHFILNGARVAGADGQSIVPEGWLNEAATERTAIGRPGRGYGYQWWTFTDGSFAARGIFGQGIFLDPKRKLVIVSNANWAGGARDRVADEAREAFYQAVRKAVDDEAAAK